MKNDSALQAIVDEAFCAAATAETKFREIHGEPLYCGFAWVTVRPGNCNLANFLKKKNLGRTGYYGGVEVWNPGKSNTQSMDIKEVGARAFADVLQKYGFKATPGSRAD
jgi:hypothetical protein